MTKNKNKGYKLDKFYSKIFKQYDLINKLFTFGMDKKWRNKTVELCLETKPNEILDLCCGTGDLSIELAKKSGDTCLVTGYDMNESMLKKANEKGAGLKSKLKFIKGKASQIPFNSQQFDCITISFGFRNLTYENPEQLIHIQEMHRVLKPGGKLIILESGVPTNAIVKLFYKIFLYLFLVPLGGIISGNFKAYYYLAKSSANFYPLYQIETMLFNEGFKEITNHSFLFGAANIMVVKK